MHQVLLYVVHVIVGLFGASLIFAALLLYEDEEGKLQNRIELWWRQVRQLHRAARSWEAAFLKVVMQITSRAIDYVFGARLFGPQAIAASTAFSMAGVYFVSTAYIVFHGTAFKAPPVAVLALVGVFFAALGSVGPLIQQESRRVIWMIFVLLFAFGWFTVGFAGRYRHYEMQEYERERATSEDVKALGESFHFKAKKPPSLLDPSHTYRSIGLSGGLLGLAITSDFFFVAVTRLILRRAAKSNVFPRTCLIAIGTSAAGVLVVAAPYYCGVKIDEKFGSESSPMLIGPSILLMMASGTNSVDGLLASLWLLLAVLMLIHHVIWPLLERPIYALHRHRIFTDHRKWVLLTGVALLGVACPPTVGALMDMIKALK